MNLKYIGVASIATILFATTNANANLLFDIYAGATVGSGAASVFAGKHNSNDPAQSYGAAIGVDVPFVRIEAEYDYLNEKNMQFSLAMANAYAKMSFPLVKPYIGAGAGKVFTGKIKNAPGTKIDDPMAYQAMMGLTFNVPTLPINFDAEARALYIPDVIETTDSKPDVLHYDLRLKLRYVF